MCRYEAGPIWPKIVSDVATVESDDSTFDGRNAPPVYITVGGTLKVKAASVTANCTHKGCGV